MSDDGSVKESSTEIASLIGMMFTILIYMFILMYGNMVMQAVLEEKKSRVVKYGLFSKASKPSSR